MVVFAFMVTGSGFTDPLAPPDQPTNTHPGAGVAVSVTVAPQAYVGAGPEVTVPHGQPSIVWAGLLTVPQPTTLSESVRAQSTFRLSNSPKVGGLMRLSSVENWTE